MKFIKELHLYDWFIIAIFLLSAALSFFVYKTFSLSNQLDDKEDRESLVKAEYEAMVSCYRQTIHVAIKRAQYFEKKYKEPKKQNIVYKKIYEKILIYPDSIQNELTDSILTECRIKPFTGNQLLFE